jgi:hypothetical protein
VVVNRKSDTRFNLYFEGGEITKIDFFACTVICQPPFD